MARDTIACTPWKIAVIALSSIVAVVLTPIAWCKFVPILKRKWADRQARRAEERRASHAITDAIR